MYIEMERILVILVAQGSSVSMERTFTELRKVFTSERRNGLVESQTKNMKTLLTGKSKFRIVFDEPAYIHIFYKSLMKVG